MTLCRAFLVFLALCSISFSQVRYEIVIRNGRAIDPETSLDAVRNIGISNGKIVAISEQPLQGAREIEAKGFVVSPGFIDLHQHDLTPSGQKIKLFDGVTSAVEFEIGPPDVKQYLDVRRGVSVLNFGTVASHPFARTAVLSGKRNAPGTLLPESGPATNNPASPDQIRLIKEWLSKEIAAGALGIGLGIQYTPGASRQEIIEMFRVADQFGIPVGVHARGDRVDSISEVIAAAAVSGAPLHIVHINSSCLKDAPECLRMVAGARARGLDVTTEAYPYIAGMTDLRSALFNPGWKEKFDLDYSDLMIPETGERLTEARFDELRKSPQLRPVIIFANTQAMVDQVIENPLVMVASDGFPGHPRNAGTYARVFRQYVRERQTLSLMDMVRKSSYMPALRLERSTPQARKKGRLQVGADADIIIFDPATFSDRSTFQDSSLPSVGMQYVLVNGTVVLSAGAQVEGVAPGRALTP